MEEQRALIEKLADKEKEIQILYRQQRDVRFLIGRLHTEVGSRLHKRANPVKKSKRLIYVNDSQIKNALNAKEQPATELLKFIHNRDAKNIIPKRQTFNYPKLIKWKAAEWTFDKATKVLKKGLSR